MDNEDDNLSDKINDINSQLVKANAFNENAALELDLIYNFFAENQKLFKHQSGSMPNLDNFFDDNGYIPVKVLNPCCCNHDDEEAIDWPKLPTIPKGKPVDVPVPEPKTVPVTKPMPKVAPLQHPISKPIPLSPPTGVVTTPPIALPTPVPTDAPINTPKVDTAPDLIGSPILPPVSDPDVTPVVPTTPIAPATPITTPDPFADSYSIGDPMGTGVEGMGIDTTTPTDLSESGPIVTAINEHPYAFLTALAAAPLLGILGLPSLPAWAYGAAGLGTASMIPIAVNAAEAPPPDKPPVLNEKEKTKLNSDYSPISYSTKDNAITDEITLKADEIKFISDVIRFKSTGTSIDQQSSSSATQNASYVPPSSDSPQTTSNNKIAINHESMLNGNQSSSSAQQKPVANSSSNMNLSGIKDISSSISSVVSSIGKTLSDLSSKTFMTAKITPKAKTSAPIQSQPIIYNSENTGHPTSGTSKPKPAMTNFEQMIFNKSGMFT